MPPGKELCPGCEELRPLLSKFRTIREEQHAKHPDHLDQPWLTVRPLSKEEAFVLMRFIKHWPANQNFAHSHIACLFKSHEDIEALHAITLAFILLGIHYAASCQAGIERRSKAESSSRQSSTGSSADTLPDNPTPSSEPDNTVLTSVSPLPSTPEVGVLRESPVEPVPSTSKEEPDETPARVSVTPTETEGDGGRTQDGLEMFAVWTPKELEEFICTYHRVFLPTYALYVAGKYIMQRELRDEMQRKTSEAGNCPPYFLDTFTYWVTQGGLSYLTSYFNQANSENSSLTEAMMLVSSAFHVRNFVYFEVFLSQIATFRISVINYLLTLPLEDFRKQQCRHIAEIMWNLRKDTSWPLGTFDLDGLNLAHKFFSCSSHLALRLIGIQEINTYILNFNELVSDLDPRIIIQLGSHIATWILERRIVEEIFGQNAHVELISRSVQIINFLSQHACLSVDQLDCIWNAAQLNYISRHVMEMLPNIVRPLEPTLLMHLYKKLCEMDAASHSEQSINVISMVIRTIWNYAIQQKTAYAARQNVDHAPRQSTSQVGPVMQARTVREAAVLHKLYHRDTGSSSEGGSSDTSGSGSEEASDSDGLESDGDVDEHPPTRIPPITALCPGKQPPVLAQLQLQAKQINSKQLKQACEAVGKAVSVPIRPAGPSEEEGSSGSEEDGEEDEVEEIRRKRSPCPSGDSPVNQKRKIVGPVSWSGSSVAVAASVANSAIMEQLRAAPGVKIQPHIKEKVVIKGNTFIADSMNDMSFKTGTTDDDVMTQGSDGADAECNSSTSDMSEKVQDLEADLMEAMPESELGDDEDDDFDMDLDMQSPHIASLINEDLRSIKTFHLANNRQITYTPRAREIAYNIDEAAKPGKTLLWDLLQEQSCAGVSPTVLSLAEKELGQIIISSGSQFLITKFCEACVTNLSVHLTVCVSLRLLTRLIQAPNSGRPFDAGNVKGLMAHFFSDLQVFADKPPPCEQERSAEIRIRLNFLQTVYSNPITDRRFRLDKDQLDKLWECLAVKLKLIDELSQWLGLVSGQEFHALTGTSYQQLFYVHLGKLEPGQMTVNAMRLYNQCLVQLNTIHIDKLTDLRGEFAAKLWGHAMFGENEVSDLAIKHLNLYYLQTIVNGHKDRREVCCAPMGESVIHYKEEELFRRSMEYIRGAMDKLETDVAAYTTIIRCITLMRKQIESYRQRYGFHLKLWNCVGNTVLSHNAQSLPMNGPPNRPYFFFHATIHLPDERPHETTLTMYSGYYLGELRAELVYYVWRHYDKNPPVERDIEVFLTDIYTFLRTKGPFSIYFRNEELLPEKDDQTLYDLSFRQENAIRVEIGPNQRKVPKFKDKHPNGYPPAPCRDTVPMLLVSSPANFEIFFQLQDMLNLLAHATQGDQERETLRKQVAKNLWDFLMLIPTSLAVSDQISMEPPHHQPTPESWRRILPSDDAHRLLYSLQALDNFYRDPNAHRSPVVRADITQVWADKFIRLGGFARLYELLLSPEVQESGGSSDNVDQHRECLSNLIRVVFMFSVEAERVKREEEEESSGESEEEEGENAAVKDEVQKKRKATEKSVKFFLGAAKRSRQEVVREGPRFKQSILEILDTDKVLDALLRIQYNTVLPKEQTEPRPVRAARHARQTVVRLAFDFLTGWASGNPDVFGALGRRPFLTDWLRRLALEAADSAVTVETAVFIDKMCRHEPEYQLSCALLVPLVGMMSLADGIKCVRTAGREDKPPMKPSPRYFYEAISKLLEIIPNPIVVEKIDLDALCEQLANSLESRPCFEPRLGNLEDDGLIGLLRVATQVLSHGPQFKFRPSGLKMLLTIFSCLFEQPCEKKRDLPKCKSVAARNAAYNCLFEITRNAPENFITLARQLLKQHCSARPIQHWDYWPRDDMRADCGYVGITNLGATCYMATTMQHLYMIPEARKAIIEATPADPKNWAALCEMQKMFAFLLESERKAYSPEGFCRSYDMNNQLLNPTEQKDMMEFFSDLVAKMEEMSPALKCMVKKLFTGTNCNTVISLDCGHVSQTTEEFTTVRCQVNNMRNLYESLNDVCVKDVLEGNNMYKCGQCNREVRAEKQACFRNLPEILVLNTLRYTFNMVTMQREKVNTHFTFPIVLDMAQYMEENLFKGADGMGSHPEQYKYELIGVTVHTGTAEGGHYYSFIRDLECGEADHWLLFNDAEVRMFDSEQLGPECFGGETKQFDNNGDRYLDFGLEKTNSAYMLFYQKVDRVREQLNVRVASPCVPKEIQQWVWKDTTEFVQDINIYDRYYFDFLWKLCYAATPSTFTLKDPHSDPVLLTGQLAISFLWETLIRARDRSQFTNFFDLSVRLALTQPSVVEWFMRQMVDDHRWLFGILVQCPISSLRSTFQRFITNLFQKLRPQPQINLIEFYAHEVPGFAWQSLVGRFCRKCIGYLDEAEVRLHWRNLNDMMHMLVDFAKLGELEAWFLVTNDLFCHCYQFYTYLRQLKDVRTPLIGPLPLFPIPGNILEMAMLATDEGDTSDRFSPDLEKDKPNTLSLMTLLLRHCIEVFQKSVFQCKLQQKEPAMHGPLELALSNIHSDIEQYMGHLTDAEQLDFLANLIRDGIDPVNAPRLAAFLYLDKPEKARRAMHHFLGKVHDLSVATEPALTKKERDRELQIRTYLNAVMEMIRHGVQLTTTLLTGAGVEQHPMVPQYMDYLLEKLLEVILVCPLLTYQWLGENMRMSALRRWVLEKLGCVLEWHGVPVGKQQTPYRDDLQIEVARLIVSLSGEQKLREIFCPYQQGLIFQAGKDKYANILTAADKIDLRLDAEQHEWLRQIIERVLDYFQKLLDQQPQVFEAMASESYQWVLFAVQFLLMDEAEKKEVAARYPLLRTMLIGQLVPEVKMGGNRQAIIQLLAAAAHGTPPLVRQIVQDDDLITRFLSETKTRGSDDVVFYENEGRYLSAVLYLLNVLALHDGDFASRLAEDPLLIAKLQTALIFKVHDSCRRPLTQLIDTLINQARYPTGKRSGEHFRKSIFTTIWDVKNHWGTPGTDLFISPISKRVMEGADEEFQMFAIENKALELLTTNFRICYQMFNANKLLTYLNEEASWCLVSLRKYRAFAQQHLESNAAVKEAYQCWLNAAKVLHSQTGLDVVSLLDTGGLGAPEGTAAGALLVPGTVGGPRPANPVLAKRRL